MTPVDVALVAAIVVLLICSIFLAVAETALTRMSRAKAQALAEDHGKRGQALQELVEHPEGFLNPVLLVVLVCQLVQATLTGVVSNRLFGAVGVAVATVFNVVVVFVVAESGPKTWAIQHGDRAALAAARPVRFLARFWPLRVISRALIGLTNVILPGKGLKQGPFVTEQELLAVAEQAVEEQVLEASERSLIESVIEFGDTVAREVMVPRTDMVTVGGDFRIADAVEVGIFNGFSRMPVTGEGSDDITGVAYLKDLMRAERDGRSDDLVSTVSRPGYFVPETKRVTELLAEMQANMVHMAILVDEYGGTAGLVTLEDLLEELVGEIFDEFDTEARSIERLPDGVALVDARLNIDDVNEELGLALPEGDWDSIGGLLFDRLGRVPARGESVDVDGARLSAEWIQGRRIRVVRIAPAPEPAEAASVEEEAAGRPR